MVLDGRVALITGGTSGIGARTAELFAAEGAGVVVAGRREERGRRLAAALGGSASFIRADVRVEADVAAMVDHAVERFGRLDCLVNSAGGLAADPGIASVELDEFDEAIAVHVRSALAGMKHAARVMVPRRSGSIVNMGSIVGIRAGVGGAAYSTAKAAVLHLTRCAAVELGEHGVRVNSVSPGPVVTGVFGKGWGLSDSAADERADLAHAALREILPGVQPLPGIGTADDVARAVLYLASDASRMVNGHDLVVDGGSVAGRTASTMRAHRAIFARAFQPREAP